MQVRRYAEALAKLVGGDPAFYHGIPSLDMMLLFQLCQNFWWIPASPVYPHHHMHRHHMHRHQRQRPRRHYHRNPLPDTPSPCSTHRLS